MRHPALGCAVMLKMETLNPIRSFKGGDRGGALRARTTPTGRGRRVERQLCANPQKVEAMRRLGAVVHLVEPGRDEADAAREAAQETGAPFIEDGAYREIAAGAGTIAQEMTAADLRPDVVLVQIGDGALVTGIGSWLKATSPGVHVVGVTARSAPAMAPPALRRSWSTAPGSTARSSCP